VLLCIALMAGVAVMSAGAFRPEVSAAPQGKTSSPWWYGLPGWIQWILRYVCFGWVWMKPPVTTQPITKPAWWPDNIDWPP
jgi:hypothetical protein